MATNRKSIKKNIAYQAFYEVLGIILPLITSPYISRVVGAEGLGVFSYTYSIAYYFQIFGMLGLKFYGNRSIAQVRDNPEKTNQVYSEILLLHIIVSIISTILYFVYSLSISQYRLYSLLQAFMVIATIFDVSWLFFGLEEFKTTVTRNTIIKLLSVLFIFAFVHQQNDLWKYILIMAVSQLAGNFMLFVMARKYVSFSMPEFKSIFKHLKPMMVLFIPVISLSLFKYMDKIMLGAIGNKIELGYYENAEKILNIPLGIIISFGSVMMPKMSNLTANKDCISVDKYLHMSIKYMMCVAVAMAFGMAGISNNFAPLFWGEEFSSCGFLIMILAISLPFSTLSNIVRNQDLIPNGKDRNYGIAIIVGAVLNLIINYLTIPKLQSVGVSIGTVVSEIAVCVVQLFMIDNRKKYRMYISEVLFYLIPGSIMFVCVLLTGKYMGNTVLTLVCQVGVGILVFGLLMAIYFWHHKDPEIIKIANSIKTKIVNKHQV